MGRRLFTLGLALSMAVLAAPIGRAQESGPLPPEVLGLPAIPEVELPAESAAPAEVKAELKVSPNTGMPRLEQSLERANIGMAQLAIESTDYIDPRYVANSLHPDDMGIWESMCVGGHEQGRRMVRDYKNFYLTENLLYVGVAIVVAAPLANTHADQGIRDWYQRGAGGGQSPQADETSRVFKWFGDYRQTVPIFLVFSVSEHLFPDSPTAQTLSEFGNRSLRALAVGAPAVGILQVGLGANRPLAQDSHWHPLRSNKSVSGHAFVGAVPFLTAASMTENRMLRAVLVAGSLGPAWSRIHDDDHYFSQALLGWAIAYLSVEAVNLTECQARHMRLVPVEVPNGMGLGLQIDY